MFHIKATQYDAMMGGMFVKTELSFMKELLKKADKKDNERKVFGAKQHQYRWAPPVSEEKLQEWEQYFGIILPKEYRSFLKEIAGGGAGPYYGIYPIEEAFCYDKELLCEQCLLKPNMTKKEWKEISENLEYDYGGILPIGTQGCTYETGLVLTGEYRGRIVYFDYDCEGIPFFVEENDFLQWYVRWLEEVINGYKIFLFGCNVGGNEETLIEKYQKAETEKRKLDILNSFFKFQHIKPKTERFIWKIQQNSSKTIKEVAADILLHFGSKKGEKMLELFWNEKQYAAAVRVISNRQKYDFEKWYEKIFSVTDILQGEDLVKAAHILSKCSKMTVGDMLKLLDNPNSTEQEKCRMVYYTTKMPQKEKYIEQYIRLFLKESDYFRLIVIQALSDVENEKLFQVYDDFIEKQKAAEKGKRREPTIGYIFSNLERIYKKAGRKF